MDAQAERTKEDLLAELRGAWLQIESLEKRLQISKDNCAAAIDERNKALDALHGQTKNAQDLLDKLDTESKRADNAEVKLAKISGLLDRAKGLGIASVEGPGLHDMRGDIDRGRKPA